jgi:peptidoglycan-associated lipoprotein
VAKRLLLVMVALALVAAGCGGGPKDELESSGADSEMSGGTMDDDMSGMTDDAGRDDMSSTNLDEMDLQTIYFDFDKYALRADAREALDRNAEIMRNNPDIDIVIEGHCDERGTDEYNLALGEKRARSARDYLVRLGVDESRISIISYGEERPVALGHDEAAWAKNRRGEFLIR